MSGSTRSHFTHARSCSRALNRVPTLAKRLGLPSRRICEFVKRRYFSVRSFCGWQEKKPKSVGKSFTVRICINVLQDRGVDMIISWIAGVLGVISDLSASMLQEFTCFRSGLSFWTKSPLCLSLVVTWSISMLLAPCLALPQVLLCQPSWIDFPNRGKLVRFRQFSVWLFVSLPHCHFADGRACF